eukprot:scaffold333666_cov38-Prasinocladus_malaysianus.AAC.2
MTFNTLYHYTRGNNGCSSSLSHQSVCRPLQEHVTPAGVVLVAYAGAAAAELLPTIPILLAVERNDQNISRCMLIPATGLATMLQA